MRLDQAAIRTYLGAAMLVGGVALEVLGWYGVSGESVEARQLPYLASASIPGAALIVGGAVLLALRSPGGGDSETARRVAELHSLLVEDATPATPPGRESPEISGSDGSAVAGPVALPAGMSFHRGDCALVAGKPDAAAVGEAEIAERGLTPCPVCEP